MLDRLGQVRTDAFSRISDIVTSSPLAEAVVSRTLSSLSSDANVQWFKSREVYACVCVCVRVFVCV